MYDRGLMVERLTSVLEALERIPRRFSKIRKPSDFNTTDEGVDQKDSICMILIAVGEEFKQFTRKTGIALPEKYPQVSWRGVVGTRDFLSHGYFEVNTQQLFAICRDDIPPLIQTVKQMIEDVRNGVV